MKAVLGQRGAGPVTLDREGGPQARCPPQPPGAEEGVSPGKQGDQKEKKSIHHRPAPPSLLSMHQGAFPQPLPCGSRTPGRCPPSLLPAVPAQPPLRISSAQVCTTPPTPTTHTHRCACTHVRTHTCTHTHTHMCAPSYAGEAHTTREQLPTPCCGSPALTVSSIPAQRPTQRTGTEGLVLRGVVSPHLPASEANTCSREIRMKRAPGPARGMGRCHEATGPAVFTPVGRASHTHGSVF